MAAVLSHSPCLPSSSPSTGRSFPLSLPYLLGTLIPGGCSPQQYFHTMNRFPGDPGPVALPRPPQTSQSVHPPLGTCRAPAPAASPARPAVCRETSRDAGPVKPSLKTTLPWKTRMNHGTSSCARCPSARTPSGFAYESFLCLGGQRSPHLSCCPAGVPRERQPKTRPEGMFLLASTHGPLGRPRLLCCTRLTSMAHHQNPPRTLTQAK